MRSDINARIGQSLQKASNEAVINASVGRDEVIPRAHSVVQFCLHLFVRDRNIYYHA